MLRRWRRDPAQALRAASACPEPWRELLLAHVPGCRALASEERERFESHVASFIARKKWEGLGGLTVHDEIRVTIAGPACLLLLGRQHALYASIDRIVVYPASVAPRLGARRFFDRWTTHEAGAAPRVGAPPRRGPLVLVFDEARHGPYERETGRNLAYHAFAHALEWSADPNALQVPNVRGDRDLCIRAFEEQFSALPPDVRAGCRTFAGTQSLETASDLFGLATQHFFEGPRLLEHRYPALYDLLRDFYGQDPSQRERLARGSEPPAEPSPRRTP